MKTTPWQPPPLRYHPAEVVLTSRQADVLTGICQGLSKRQIARQLYLTENTVRTHVRRLHQVLGVRTQAHAVAVAMSPQTRVTVRGSARSTASRRAA